MWLCPERPAEAYKGSMGDVLFIAGAANYYGAPYFAAMSFLKSGGGYARLAAPRCVVPVIAKRGREIVYLPQEETAAGSIAFKNKRRLLEAAAKVDMVVIGPGLSLQEETVKLVKELAVAIKVPLLIDGDGLTAIAENHGNITQPESRNNPDAAHGGNGAAYRKACRGNQPQ